MTRDDIRRGWGRRVGRLGVVLAVSAVGALPATVATCNRTSENSGNFYLTSSNENLLGDALDLLFDHDDD